MVAKISRFSLVLAVIPFLLFTQAACSNQTVEIPTVTLTLTSRPTGTAAPTAAKTNTPQPTNTPNPTDTPTPTPTTPPPTATEPESDFPLPMPSGAPAADWEGIPIKPEAIAGEEGKGSYYYTVENTVEEVQLYYEQEMGKYGWSLFAVGQGQNDSTILIFQKAEELVTISIFKLEDRLSYVFIVR